MAPDQDHGALGFGIERRRLMKAAVWATPLVAAAATAPMAAASNILRGITLLTGSDGQAARGVQFSLVDASDTPVNFPDGTVVEMILDFLVENDAYAYAANPDIGPGNFDLNFDDQYTDPAYSRMKVTFPSLVGVPYVYFTEGDLHGSVRFNVTVFLPDSTSIVVPQVTLVGIPV